MTMRLPTPFHVRTAERNPANAWVARGGFTVPAHFGDVQQEVLAARVSAVLADAGAREDLRVEGEGAAALLSAACGMDAAAIEPGAVRSVYWCADGGGVRGIGRLYRFGETDYLLRSLDADLAWFEPAAPRFGASLRDETQARGLLLLAGPFAFAVLAAAGLEDAVALEPGRHRDFVWRGIDVTVSRLGPCGGYEIACAADDGVIVFDRFWRAGRRFGLRPIGQEAFELLQLEAGEIVQGLDFHPAREAFAREPLPASLGLARGGDVKLMGVECDADEPARFSPLFAGNTGAGRTLRSAYSPALKRAIALASVASDCASGTALTVRRADGSEISARAVSLPFLP